MLTEKQQRYFDHINFETTHRKKWLKRPVMTKRYIRGILRNEIKERIHSRSTGDRTTDPIIRARVIAKTAGVCYLCKRRYNPRLAQLLPHLFFATIQIDHIVPFSKMGPNDVSNYLVTCARCNNRKSDLTLAEFKAGKHRGWHS